MRWLCTHWWLLAVFALASFVMLWRLDARPYVNFDEAIHGEVSWEMVEHGDWLTPSYTNGPYFRKPPLKLWLTAGLFELFGVNPWTLRLPSALAGIGVVLLTAWWMWEWRRSQLAAFLAGTIVATSPTVFDHAFRTGEMDGMLTFFVLLALYAWWKTVPWGGRKGKEQRWLLLCGAAVGLAVMTKSAAGLLPLPIIALHWLLYHKTIRIPLRALFSSMLAFLILALPWHLAMTLRHGSIFWEQYVGWHVVHRVTTQLHNEGTGPLWYINAFARTAGPYAWWMLAALIGISAATVIRSVRWLIINHSPIAPLLTWLHRHVPHMRHAIDRMKGLLHTPTADLLTIWFLTVFIGFSFVQTRFAWYLLPLFPATAMLVARCACIANLKLKKTRRFVAALIIVTTVHASVQTLRELVHIYPPSPTPAIIVLLQTRNADGLVAYGFDWRARPADYFALRTALPDVRMMDGFSDPVRAGTWLAMRDHAWLITHTTTELPKELRATVAMPHHIGDWSLWERLAPP